MATSVKKHGDFVLTLDSDDENDVQPKTKQTKQQQAAATLAKKQKEPIAEKSAFEDSEEEEEEKKHNEVFNAKFKFDTKAGIAQDFDMFDDDIMQTFDKDESEEEAERNVEQEMRKKDNTTLYETDVYELPAIKKLVQQMPAPKLPNDDGDAMQQENDDDDDDDGGVLTSVPEDTVKEFMKHKKSAVVQQQEQEEEDEEEANENNYDKTFFKEAEEDANDKGKTFNEMNLSRQILRALDKLGFRRPTPIQERCIPLLLQGQDICASAQTGSGKTAAFLLPTIERLMYRNKKSSAATRVLILLPTRELATQCFEVARQLTQFTDIRCCCITGGKHVHKQRAALMQKPEILIATPGRVVDHLLNTPQFGLANVEILILDEADRLLDLGFQTELEEIVQRCPKNRQTMLFSATMTDNVDELIKLSLQNPVRIAVGSRNDVASNLYQEVVRIKDKTCVEDKEAALFALCTRTYTSQVIVFSNYKKATQRLRMLFYLNGLKASELHADISQEARLLELDRFAKKKTDFLFCTDVASRGLDIKGVQTVINFDMARELKTYIHRVGRTARAGAKGTAVSLVMEEDRPLLKQIVKRAKKIGEEIKLRELPKEAVWYWKNKILDLQPKLGEVEKAFYEQRSLVRAHKQIEEVEDALMTGVVSSNHDEHQWIRDEQKHKPKKRKPKQGNKFGANAAAAAEGNGGKKEREPAPMSRKRKRLTASDFIQNEISEEREAKRRKVERKDRKKESKYKRVKPGQAPEKKFYHRKKKKNK